MIKVYCLYDPLECKVRYVGRTSKKVLEHRLIEHITKAKYFEKYYEGKRLPYRINWIKKLLKEGREPKIKLLTKVEGWKESHNFERALINKWKNKRNLVNLEDRGEGGKNRIVTSEDKLKISNSLKNYYKTNLNGRAKTVHVFNLDGKYLKSYVSTVLCSNDLNIPNSKVIACCNNVISRYKNWIFSYNNKVAPYIKKKRKIGSVLKRRKNYLVTDLETSEIFKFKGTESVCLFLNIDKGNFPKYLKRGICKKKYKIQVLYKSDELLETHQKTGNQQPS
jgi:hypothetical protein